jgi:hypothetical protein
MAATSYTPQLTRYRHLLQLVGKIAPKARPEAGAPADAQRLVHILLYAHQFAGQAGDLKTLEIHLEYLDEGYFSEDESWVST